MSLRSMTFALIAVGLLCGNLLWADESQDTKVRETPGMLDLQLRSQKPVYGPESQLRRFQTVTRDKSWDADKTAVIVCDVWDYHHCLNAVRRLEQFVPRLDQVISEARRRGAIIIHAPSDCMDAYVGHPARQRAQSVSLAKPLPAEIASWCSSIPAEEAAVYPIDQSDGGEDDDPVEHQQWEEKLAKLGRDPALPWKRQHEAISIDRQRDFISDRGDEVWSILQQHGIQNVILAGVHTNMCVLGRPFGLRQMVRNGINVVLIRDMTDSMYNPDRWPYVSHFEGHRRVIAHVERYVCPTITSDQLIAGQPFRFQGDETSSQPFLEVVEPPEPSQKHWSLVELPQAASDPASSNRRGRWYRAVVQLPAAWLSHPLVLSGIPTNASVWLNGVAARRSTDGYMLIADAVAADDFSLLVVQTEEPLTESIRLVAGSHCLPLAGRWQSRPVDGQDYANMPLPAKFGGSADIVYTPDDPS